MEKSKKREIKRIRHILDEIVSLAEDDELRDGLINAVKRYNSILRHLETSEVLPASLFQQLSEGEGAVSFHQAAVECRMLSGYLDEVAEEDDEDSHGKPDFSPVIALAPFLDQSDLKALVHSHLSGKGFSSHVREEMDDETGNGAPSLRMLAELAPHMSKQDLAEMAEACLAREPLTDTSLILALAPHLDRKDLGRILRRHAPAWFGGKGEPSDDSRPAPSGTELTTTYRQETFGEPKPDDP